MVMEEWGAQPSTGPPCRAGNQTPDERPGGDRSTIAPGDADKGFAGRYVAVDQIAFAPLRGFVLVAGSSPWATSRAPSQQAARHSPRWQRCRVPATDSARPGRAPPP